MMEDSPIIFESRDGVATITLNRPQVYNAFNDGMHADLMQALKQAERDQQVRCIVITGAGKAFCSGQDLKDIPMDGSRSLGEHVRERYNPLVLKLRSIPKPIIAAVNGVAAGAGMSLALACDLRVAVETARFVASFSNVGLVPDTGATYFLPRLIGHARALELCMLGATIDAPTAHSYGMVNQIASPDEFAEVVQRLAECLANGAATALGLMKRSFELSLDAALPEVLDYEAQAQQIAGSSAEYAEGVQAFREKRSPRFREVER